MRNTLLSFVLVSAFSLISPAFADDIELFNASPDILLSNNNPNVLIILDNSANWNDAQQKWTNEAGTSFIPQGESEIKALKTVISSLPPTVSVGLMMFVKSSGNPTGAYVRFAIRPMTEENKSALMKVFEKMSVGGYDQVAASDTDYSAAFFEAYKYFGGWGHWINGASVQGSPRNSTNFGPIPRGGAGGENGLRDYPGNVFYGQANRSLPDTYSAGGAWNLLGYSGSIGSAAYSSSSTTTSGSSAVSYVEPDYASNPCGNNYILFIGNGYPSKDDGSTLLNNVKVNAGTLTQIDSSIPFYADEWARFLYSEADVSSYAGRQNVITYAVNVCKDKCNLGEGPKQAALLSSMASDRAGRGRYFLATNENELNLAFSTFFNDVQAVNSVFASATLPVSVNVRGTNANQVYIGVFRPDADSLPRWYGNLKQYRLTFTGANSASLSDDVYSLYLTDARSSTQASFPAVVDSTTGNFTSDALSYWTTPNPAPVASLTGGFWSFSPSGTPLTSYDSPDGAIVEKGGVGQVLRTTYATSQTARKVLTCQSCSSGASLTNFNTSLVTCPSTFTMGTGYSSPVGTTGANAECTDQINWLRGQDNSKGWNDLTGQDENRNGDYTDVRASIHGDVLHSRPAVVNYNRYSTASTVDENDVVIFYGANDGLFRAIKGGQGPTNGVAEGTELWSFIPAEFFPKIKRLRDNFPPVTSASGLTTKTLASTGAASSTALTFANQPLGSLVAGMIVTGSGVRSNTFVTGITIDSTTTPKSISGVTLSQSLSAAVSNVTFTPTPKDYFMDGPIGVYTKDVNNDGALKQSGGDAVQLFIGMRRGGRFIYALDVSDPATPKFMWKKSSTDSGWGELGYTWSEPKVATINLGGTATTVLIFGAGYDPAYEDQDPVTTDNRSMGRGVFVVKASDGSIIWKAGSTVSQSTSYSIGTPYGKTVAAMSYAIPSDLTLIDRNNNGYVDRAYVGDTGGNVWRIDIGEDSGSNTPDNWTVSKLASVGVAETTTSPSGNKDSANDAKTQRRKFLYPPDVVASKDSYGAYDAVLIGSGDREHPFNGYGSARVTLKGLSDDPGHPAADTVLNRFYMFKDRDVGIGSNGNQTLLNVSTTPLVTATTSGAVLENQLADITQADNSASTLTVTATNGTSVQIANRGWYRSLVYTASNGTETAVGEKVVGSAVTLNNVTFFNTNVPNPPDPNTCGSNLGIAREYDVSTQTGQAGFDLNGSGTITSSDLYKELTNAGFLPSPVGVIVTINGKTISTVLSGPNTTGGGALTVGKKYRTYWHKKIDSK